MPMSNPDAAFAHQARHDMGGSGNYFPNSLPQENAGTRADPGVETPLLLGIFGAAFQEGACTAAVRRPMMTISLPL